MKHKLNCPFIDPEARRIAVAWMEGWEEWMKSDIAHKVKLASDIMNFAIAYHQHQLEQLPKQVVSCKRPNQISDEEILQTLDIAQAELRAMYKRLNYLGSNVLSKVDAVHEALKAACASGAVAQSGRDGCVHHTLEYVGPWYTCKNCGKHLNASAEAPSEGALF